MPSSNVNWPVPLTRFPTLWPGQMGVDGTDHDRGERLHCSGEIFYVDPNYPGVSDQRDGTSPTDPLQTVGAALTHCQAYRGDVIAVMFNADWTYSNPTLGQPLPIQEAVTVTVPGVRIVGVAPSGSLGVPWVPSANNQTLITVTAMDVLIEGFAFWDLTYGGITAIHGAWDAPPWGENLTVRHCYVFGLDYGVQLDYAWNSYIEHCRFDSTGVHAVHNPSVYGEPDYLTVRDNVFINSIGGSLNLPDVDFALIEGNRFINCGVAITITGGDNNTILDNTILGDGTGTNNFINLTGGSDNLVGGNYLSCTIAQYDVTCSDATSGSWGGNHCANGDTAAAPV